MRIAFCDDEIEYARALSERIKRHEGFAGAAVSLFSSGNDLWRTIEDGGTFDMYFLDIDMPGIGGLELGKKLNALSQRSIIIFVTNHEKYAIDAFDCDACGFLLKDCDENRFAGTLERALRRYRSMNKSIYLDTEEGTVSIPIDSILHIEYAGRRCLYHTETGVYPIRRSLTAALEELEGFGFVRIHQYRVVNLAKISAVRKSTVVLVDGSSQELSRYRRNEVLQKYIRFRKESL